MSRWGGHPRTIALMAPETTHSLVQALQAVPDFEALDERALLRIVGASANLFYPGGARIFEKGDPSEALYVLLSGRVRIFEPGGGREVDVDEIHPGHSFGELSLLLETTHTKTAEAIEEAEILVLPERSFKNLLEDNEDLAEHFQKRIAEQAPMRGEVSESA